MAGVARPASDDDRALLVEWVEQFFVETFGHRRDYTAGAAFLDETAAKGDE